MTFSSRASTVVGGLNDAMKNVFAPAPKDAGGVTGALGRVLVATGKPVRSGQAAQSVATPDPHTYHGYFIKSEDGTRCYAFGLGPVHTSAEDPDPLSPLKKAVTDAILNLDATGFLGEEGLDWIPNRNPVVIRIVVPGNDGIDPNTYQVAAQVFRNAPDMAAYHDPDELLTFKLDGKELKDCRLVNLRSNVLEGSSQCGLQVTLAHELLHVGVTIAGCRPNETHTKDKTLKRYFACFMAVQEETLAREATVWYLEAALRFNSELEGGAGEAPQKESTKLGLQLEQQKKELELHRKGLAGLLDLGKGSLGATMESCGRSPFKSIAFDLQVPRFATPWSTTEEDRSRYESVLEGLEKMFQLK